MSNMESLNHLNQNQVHNINIANRKEKEESRSRQVGGHRKALESYDSKIGNFNYAKKNLTIASNNVHKLYGVHNMLFKNATQGVNDEKNTLTHTHTNTTTHTNNPNPRKKGSAYINIKSFREKDLKTTNKKQNVKVTNEDKNKENADINNISRMHAMIAIKVHFLLILQSIVFDQYH